MVGKRWFCVAKYPGNCRVGAVYTLDGRLVYEIPVDQKDLQQWWIFLELEPGLEKPEGPVREGVTCALLYPEPETERVVLACVYSHKPAAGYPRIWQVPPDDLPEGIRTGTWHDNKKQIFFPDQNELPFELQPVYGALMRVGEPGQPIQPLIKDTAYLISAVQSGPPGGSG